MILVADKIKLQLAFIQKKDYLCAKFKKPVKMDDDPAKYYLVKKS
jgi:hypothetical protein